MSVIVFGRTRAIPRPAPPSGLSAAAAPAAATVPPPLIAAGILTTEEMYASQAYRAIAPGGGAIGWDAPAGGAAGFSISGGSMHPRHRDFATTVNGDNEIISGAPGFRIAVYQLEVYNAVAQTLTFKNGAKLLQPVLTDFAAGAGFSSPYQDEPRWVLDYGQSLVLNAPIGAANGFVKYRMLANWEE